MRTEHMAEVATIPIRDGKRSIADVVGELILGARIAHARNEGDGASWVTGEIDGEWIELRVTIRERPETANQGEEGTQ